jgi:hypothetical protein
MRQLPGRDPRIPHPKHQAIGPDQLERTELSGAYCDVIYADMLRQARAELCE